MKCPGQDTQYWKPGAIYEARCPECGEEVEFFKDDPSRKCPNCGHRFLNPALDFGCAAYCQYAEQCLGNLPPELIAQKQELFKDRVAIEMKKYFGRDFKRIGHAMKVARYAEQIGKKEGANMAVVLISAYLHDIGIKEAERKYQSNDAKYQEKEGPPVAREILKKLGADESLIEEVLDIIGHHHHPAEDETLNFKCVYDADAIVNLEEKQNEKLSNPETLERVIDKIFLTKTGKELAKEALIRRQQ